MDSHDAEIDLAEGEVLVFAKGSIAHVKKLRDQCLEADIPAMLGRCDPKGWTSTAELLVREQDVREIATLLQQEWIDMVRAEGTVEAMVDVAPTEDGDLPCPACGTVAPLVEGACSDCGLQLE